MKPYYDHKGITIYHGDCRAVLAELPKDCADLIIADPPYGVSWQGRAQKPLGVLAGDDGSFDVIGMLAAACRCLRRGRHLYVFGPFAWGEDAPFCAKAELIWDKQVLGTGDLSVPWGPEHERITFAVYQPSRANRKGGFGRLSARLRQGSVIQCKGIHAARSQRHPTEKPVKLIRQLIEASSCMDETVLDPVMGIGTSLVAARLEGRKAIGIEIEEKYCEIAARRLGQEILPFVETPQKGRG